MSNAHLWHVIDHKDELVLFSGTYEECVTVQDTHYAGLSVVHDTDYRQYGTKYFTSIYLIPFDAERKTCVLCIKTPDAYIRTEFPSAIDALGEALNWLDKRGLEPTIMDIPFRVKQ